MSSVTNPSVLVGAEIVTLVSSIYRLTGALWIIPLCLIFYDILITIDAEVKYFWNRSGGSLTRSLYFLNRYWPAGNLVFHNIVLNLAHPTPSFCVAWFQYTAYSAGAQHVFIGAILIMRIYAMFNCNRRLLIILLTGYVIWIGTETVILGIVTHRFHSNEALRDIFPGCAPTNIPVWCYWYWVPSLTFESFLLVLASWKTIQEARATMLGKSKLMAVLLRDSVLYFGGVTLFTIANFLAWYIAPLPLYGMFVGCHIGFQSIIGSRMLLNIRETASKSGTQVSSTLISTVQFKSGNFKHSSISSISTMDTLV